MRCKRVIPPHLDSGTQIHDLLPRPVMRTTHARNAVSSLHLLEMAFLRPEETVIEAL
jgi:hypothetical protein